MLKIVFIILIIAVNFAHAQNAEFYNSLDSSSYSDNLPIFSLIKGMKSPYEPGEIAFTRNKFAFGFKGEDYSLSAIYRNDYHFNFNRDALEIIYNSQNGIKEDAGKNYSPKLRVNHLSAMGFEFVRKFKLAEGWNLEISSAILNGKSYQYGDLEGNLSIDSSGNYNGDLRLNYYYDEDRLLKRNVSSPSGLGYTIGFVSVFKPSNNITVRFRADDLISYIRWEDSPYTIAAATSATRSVASDGSFKVKPTLAGVELNDNKIQRLPLFIVSDISYSLDSNKDIFLKISTINGVYLPEIGARKILSNSSYYGVRYDFITSGLGCFINFKNFSFNVLSDSIDYSRAHRLELSVSYAVPL